MIDSRTPQVFGATTNGGSSSAPASVIRRRLRLGARTAVIVVSGLLLAGCASSAPGSGASGTPGTPAATSTPRATPAATAAPTPTPTPDETVPAATVSTIEMSGSGLSSETEAGDPISAVNFADGTDASVAFLTAALAAAPEQSVPGEMDACNDVTARYSWGDTALVLDVWEPAGFVITLGESSVNGIRLQSSADFAAGENAQAFFDALPAEQAVDEYGDGTGPFVYDLVADSSPWGEANAYGGVALLQQGGIVNRIIAPDTTRAFYC